MSEAENYKAGKEARADVVHRAAHSPGSTEVVQRLVEAAFYRETHRAEPQPSTEDNADDTQCDQAGTSKIPG